MNYMICKGGDRMLCKRCGVPMNISGTSYWRNKDKTRLVCKRFSECPNCHIRQYDNSKNPQGSLFGFRQKQTM